MTSRRPEPLGGRATRWLCAAVFAAASGCMPIDVIDHGITPCNAASCEGCCSSDGRCIVETSIFYCGQGGVSCDRCAPDEVCSAGACVSTTPQELPDGGDPLPACRPDTCDGCCDGDACVPLTSQSSATCGLGGFACGACAGGDFCNGGVCESSARCKLVTSVLNVGYVGLLQFGRMPVGGTATMPIELKNVGAAECRVGAPAWLAGSDVNAFGFGGAPVYPTTIPPGQRATFPVTFTPYAERSWDGPVNAFTITANDALPSECATNQPGCRRVIVEGEGIASALTPSAPLVPETLAFREVTTGCASPSRAVLLVNESSQPMQLLEASSSDPAFEVLTPVPQTIAPWGTGQVRVRFLPAAAGKRSAVLTLRDSIEGVRSVTLQGEGVASATRSQTFLQPSPSFADVLFVVHNAASMSAVQQELAQSAAALATAAQSNGNASQFGVITSDATLANAGLLQGSPKFVASGASAAPQLEANLDVELSGSIDQSLEAARLAVLPPNATDPLRNAGFLRHGARLAVVMVSDDADRSAGAIDDYLGALQAAIDAPPLGDRLRLYPIVPASACATGGRLHDAITKVGGLCQKLQPGLIDDQLRAIAADLYASSPQFALTQPVDVSQPLTVSVDGAPASAPGQYTFDAARNAVVFGPSFVPEAGRTVQITYAATCQP